MARHCSTTNFFRQMPNALLSTDADTGAVERTLSAYIHQILLRLSGAADAVGRVSGGHAAA